MKGNALLSYEDRIVAFVDILGYRSLVARLASDTSLHQQLHAALTEIKSMKSYAGAPNIAQQELGERTKPCLLAGRLAE